MTLEQILQKYFGLEGNLCMEKPKEADGCCYTKNGYKAYSRLADCLYDLSSITTKFEINKLLDDLDRIEYEHY